MAYNPKTITVSQGGTGLNTITAYNLLVGNATSAPSLIAPSATSGIPLISQGASANPTYGTAVVAGGGTGVTSNTAYAVLCGGTTATGAVQSIASVGTSSQVLTSNGPGALPTFQSLPASIPVYFMAWSNATYSNVTGDGTTYSMIYNTTVKNVGGGYNNTTGIFTVPTTGLYYFTASMQMSGMTSAHTGMIFYVQNTGIFNSSIFGVNPYVIYGNTAFGNNSIWISTSGMALCTAGTTVSALLTVSNGAKVITLNPANACQFSGFYVGA